MQFLPEIVPDVHDLVPGEGLFHIADVHDVQHRSGADGRDNFAGASPKRYISRGRAMPTVIGNITVQSKIHMTAHPAHSTMGTYFNPQ